MLIWSQQITSFLWASVYSSEKGGLPCWVVVTNKDTEIVRIVPGNSKLSNSYLQNEWIYRRKALSKFNYLLITISEVGRRSLRAITQTQQSKTYVKLRQLSPAVPREWQRNSNSNGDCCPWIISVVDQSLSCHHTTKETGSVSKSFWKGQLLFRPGGTVQTHCYGSE